MSTTNTPPSPRAAEPAQLRQFITTVIDGGARDGRYFRADDPDVARQARPDACDCAICEARAAHE